MRAEVPHAATTGAWELVYLPVIDLATGMVTGAEARTRWHHPDLDQLSPGRCLGILQRAGQLPGFVHSLLHRALGDAAALSASGFRLSVIVALTPQAIATPDLEAAIRASLATHRLDSRWLTLQLTHTTGVGHSPPVDTNLAGLHSAGVRIALDGTGTSMLTALHELPVDELRIAPEFVTGASARAAALIGAIVEFARRFDLPVCAEGIEQHRQRRAMWELGCTHGQGPLFGRPVTADALLATLRHGYEDTPGRISPPLNKHGIVIRLPRQRGHSAPPL